jgi:hypothetical protein
VGPCVRLLRGHGWELRLFINFQFLGGELKRVDMNASRMGSSEIVYFELTDLHLHIRTTIRNESPAIKLICVRFSALKGFTVSGRVPDLMERPKMKSDVVPGQNWKGVDFPAVSALASTQTFREMYRHVRKVP